MRWLVVAALAGCGGGSDQLTPDAGPAADASQGDASTVPGCATLVPVDAEMVHGVVSDGTNLFVSVKAIDGTFQLLTMPFGGGAPMTIVTGAEPFVIAASGDAVFYQALVGNNYELHQRVGVDDTVLGSVPANGPIELEANATDLYVLGVGNGGKGTLWRLPRSGGNGQPDVVIAVSGAAVGLALGSTVGAFYFGASSAFEIFDLADPYAVRETEGVGGGAAAWFAGDNGFAFTAGMITQNTHWVAVNQFTPSHTTIYTATLYQTWLGPIFTDEHYVYLIGAGYMNPDGTNLRSYCAAGARGAQDATHLFGVLANGAGHWNVTIAPKPP